MGGKIWLDDDCQTGATFHFTLPAGIQEGDSFNSDIKINGSTGKEATKALSILLVEDHPLNRKLTAAQLKKLGHSSSFAQDGRECIQVLAREKFDLILMDLQMPVMDGYEAASRIRNGEAGSSSQWLPIIAISANASNLAQERCMEVGMNDYFSKPVTMSNLKKALEYWTTKAKQANPRELAKATANRFQ